MGGFTAPEPKLRLLGLGNEILADDAFGILAAREVGRRYCGAVEVAMSSEGGFDLIDELLGAPRVLVVDTIQTGNFPPGTIRILDEAEIRPVPGQSPHFIGLFEALAVARELGMDVPRRVTIAAVEAADCATVGGAMHPAVRAAIPKVAAWVGECLKSSEIRHA